MSKGVEPAGIYIHIPFCKTKCNYCDFYKITDEARVDDFVEALCAEAHLRKNDIPGTVETIYFGGGTPSRLGTEHFDAIFNRLYSLFSIAPTAEITVEGNPDDLTDQYLSLLARQPVNRLSIGIQSFDDEELGFLSRRHTAQQAIDAVQHAQQQGFENISIDLMYGLPGQTVEVWQRNLEQATKMNLAHLSAYHLIYEEGTVMHSLLQSGKIKPVDEEVSATMFLMLVDHMAQHGFIHYEVTAFGKEGYFSRHNSSYWKNRKYLGLGPAAHSYDGGQRSWNIASLTKYIQGVKSGELEREIEMLTIADRYNEFIITGLRTRWGVNLLELERRFGNKLYRYCLDNAQKFIDKGLLKIDTTNTTGSTEGNTAGNSTVPVLKTTRKGIFITDGIASDLMWVD